MHSSTSSSDSAIPRGPTGAYLILSAALFLTLMGVTEFFWRFQGHSPSIAEDYAHWSLERERIYDGNPNTVVLLGHSRMQVIDSDSFAQACPGYTLVQLATSGKDPLAVLRDLAADSQFVGTVICAVSDRAFTPDEHDASDYVRHYHESWTLNAKLNRQIATLLQWRLASLNPRVGLTSVVTSLREMHGLPKPLYAIRMPSRQVRVDFSSPSIANRLIEDPDLDPRTDGYDIPPPDHRPVSAEVWLKYASEYDRLASQIVARGGSVAFVVLPISGTTLTTAHAYYPRGAYWDRFASESSAVALHFEDVPALMACRTPDTSHVDAVDAPKLTRLLVEVLKERGLFDKKNSPAASASR